MYFVLKVTYLSAALSLGGRAKERSGALCLPSQNLLLCPAKEREGRDPSEPRTCCGKMACNLAKKTRTKTKAEKENKGNKNIVWQESQPKEPADEQRKGERLISKAVESPRDSRSQISTDSERIRTPLPISISNPTPIHSKLIYVLFALLIFSAS